MADAVAGAAKANGHTNGTPSSYASKFELADHFIGGNKISQARASKVKDFVAANDGHTVITNVSNSLETRAPHQRSLRTDIVIARF